VNIFACAPHFLEDNRNTFFLEFRSTFTIRPSAKKRRELKRHVTSDDSSRSLFILRERDVNTSTQDYLLQNSSNGLSGVIFFQWRKKREKGGKAENSRGKGKKAKKGGK